MIDGLIRVSCGMHDRLVVPGESLTMLGMVCICMMMMMVIMFVVVDQ